MSKRTRSSSELQIRNSLLRTTENRGQSRISSLQRRARLILQRAEYLPHEFESDPDFLADGAHNVGRGIKRSLGGVAYECESDSDFLGSVLHRAAPACRPGRAPQVREWRNNRHRLAKKNIPSRTTHSTRPAIPART